MPTAARLLPLSLLALALPAHAYVYEVTDTGIPIHWVDQIPSSPATLDILYDFRDATNPDTSVTYTNSVTSDQQALFVTALSDWSALTGNKIVFTRSTTASIDSILNLGFGDLAAVGGTSGGNVLGLTQTFFFDDGAIPQSTVWLDSAHTWDLTIGNGNPADSATHTVDFYSVALHEIGHALGLDHSNSPPNNIMTAALSGEKLGPAIDDINGLDNLYGVNPALYYNSLTRTPDSVTVGSPFAGPNRFYNFFSGNPSVFEFYTNSGTTTVTGAMAIQEKAKFHMSGGIWTVNSLTVGISATNFGLFDLSAGTFTVNTTTTVNASSSLTLSGGLLQTAGLTGTGVFNWTGGTLSLTNGGSAALLGKFITVPATGRLITTSRLTLNALTLNGPAQLLHNSTTQITVATGIFTLAGTTNAWSTTLDLTDNLLNLIVVDTTSKATILSTLANQVKSGNHNGDWLGTGITSSTVATDPNHFALGIFDNTVLGKTTFGTGNSALHPNDLFVVQALIGDTNFDNIVNAADLTTLQNNWHTSALDWSHGDLNFDGFVDSLDANIILAHWDAATPFSAVTNYTAGFSFTLTPVPEPAALRIVMMAVPLLLRRRRGVG